MIIIMRTIETVEVAFRRSVLCLVTPSRRMGMLQTNVACFALCDAHGSFLFDSSSSRFQRAPPSPPPRDLAAVTVRDSAR